MAKENMRACWMASFPIYNHKPQAGSQHCAEFSWISYSPPSTCLFYMSTDFQYLSHLPHSRWQFHQKHRSYQRISILPWTHLPSCRHGDCEHCAFFPRLEARIIPIPVWSQLHSFSPTQVKCSCCNTPLSVTLSGIIPINTQTTLYTIFEKRKNLL